MTRIVHEKTEDIGHDDEIAEQAAYHEEDASEVMKGMTYRFSSRRDREKRTSTPRRG